MPKATDIVGTIRMPEAGYGRFWNFMRSMPGAEFTPLLDAQAIAAETPGKPQKGMTGKYIVLRALKYAHIGGLGAQTIPALTAEIVKAGKAPNSIGGILHELVKAKRIKRTDDGYLITSEGLKYV